MSFNDQTLTRVHVHALAGFYIYHLKGSQSLDLHQSVFLNASLYYRHHSIDETLRCPTVHIEFLGQHSCQHGKAFL